MPAPAARSRACQRPLRTQLYFDLAVEIQTLKNVLFSPTYDAIILRTCPPQAACRVPFQRPAVVQDQRQVAHGATDSTINAVFRIAAQAETARSRW